MTNSIKRWENSLKEYFTLAKVINETESEIELDNAANEITLLIERLLNWVQNRVEVEATDDQRMKIEYIIVKARRSMYDFDKHGLRLIKIIGINNM